MNAVPYEFKYLGPPDDLYDPYRDAGDKYYYDAEEAEKKVRFFKEQLTLTKGKWKGKPFEPFPWAEDIIRCVFGWREVGTGLRRYTTVFIYVPRKNAKSELVAGIANTIFFTDPEPDNELYVAAKNSKQAGTLYRMALNMMEQNEEMEEQITSLESTKTVKAAWDNTKMCVVSQDGDAVHSLSPGFAAIDELHVHPNYKLIEGLITGMGAREQPLVIYLTTADIDRDSPCNEEKEYADKVKSGEWVDERYLSVIFECDPSEDWESPEIWAKYNPSFPVTPSLAFLEGQYKKAKRQKSKEISFKRLYLNMKVSSVQGWLDMDIWREGNDEFEEKDEYGNMCFAGIDLASKKDIGGYGLYFPDSGRVIMRFYITKKAIKEDKTGYYRQWVDDGFIKECGSKKMDYDMILKDLVKDAGLFKIMQIAFDAWNANQFSGWLEKKRNPATQKNFELVEFRQNTSSFNEPSKEFEVLIDEGLIKHNNPVLDWMAQNVCILIDANENIRPVKPSRGSKLKIDGIVMVIMALGLWMSYDFEHGESVYEEKELLIL